MKRMTVFAAMIAAGVGLGGLAAPQPADAGGSVSLYVSPKSERGQEKLSRGLRAFSHIQRGRGMFGGDNNSAHVNQHGSGNHTGIYQRGDNHHAGTGQYGNDNTLGVFQFGDGADAHVNQHGDGQAGVLFQHGW
ncbi:MAG: curlin [Dichotomicrobium sp.]